MKEPGTTWVIPSVSWMKEQMFNTTIAWGCCRLMLKQQYSQLCKANDYMAITLSLKKQLNQSKLHIDGHIWEELPGSLKIYI